MKVYWTQFAEDKLEDIYNYYKFKVGNIVAYELINGITETTSIISISGNRPTRRVIIDQSRVLPLPNV